MKMQPLSGNQRPDLLTSLMNMSLVLRLPRETRSERPKVVQDHQLRALFRHVNFQKWSENGAFLCILTWTCASHHNGVHSSTSQLPKVVREWRALHILTWKCASRHNGVHLHLLSSHSFSSLIFFFCSSPL